MQHSIWENIEHLGDAEILRKTIQCNIIGLQEELFVYQIADSWERSV